MRLMLIAWTIIIFILTCTADVYRLLEGEIKFVINADPHWSELFTLVAWQDVSWVEFIGHFTMFFILTGILIGVCKKVISAVVLAALYGIATELLQPFFSRGAEGIDLLANATGIILGVVLYSVVSFGVRLERRKAGVQGDGRVHGLM